MFWAHKTIILYVDNLAVVTICNTGYTRDKHLATCTRSIWLLTSIHEVNLEVRHIPGYQNKTADLLSRWTESETCKNKLSKLVQCPTWHKCHNGTLQWIAKFSMYYRVNSGEASSKFKSTDSPSCCLCRKNHTVV